MEANCETCPVPAGLECDREPVRCRRASRPGEELFRATLVKRAKIRASGVRETIEAETSDPPPTVAESLVLLRLMKTCPHRSPCPGCSHKGICALGKGNAGTVRDADCFACIRESGMEHPKKI